MPGNPLETTYFAGFMVFFIDVVTETGLKVFYSCLGRNDQINAYLSSRKVSIELAKVFPKTLHQRVCSGNAKPDLFDISTLISILTCDTLKLLLPPINGWTVNNPPGTDVSTSADLLRLRKIRNKLVAHRSKAKFTKEEFESYFQTVEDILKRITQDYDPGSAPDLEKTCSKYKNMEVLLPLDKNKYFVKLQEWHNDFMDQVQKVLDGIKGLKIFFEKQDDKHKRYIKLLSEGGRLVLYKYLQTALEQGGETIEEMLDRNRNTLTTKLVHQEMITSLYPPNDAGETSLNTDVHSWSLLLLARVILTVFSSSIKRNERKNIESLVKATENLAVTTKQALDKDRFAHSCENLVHNILTLSECLDEETESRVETILNTYRSQTEDVRNIDEHLRTLGCQGFTSFIDMYTAAVREYRGALAQLGNDDEYFKNTHVLKLKVVLFCEDVEKKQVAERELKALLQAAISYCSEQLDSEQSENKPVLEMIKHLKNMPTVQLLEVKEHCVILSIQCQAKQGILQLIGYIDGPEFQSHLTGISKYIEEMYQEIFFLKGHFTLNSVYKAHPDRWQSQQDESNDLQLACTSPEETGQFEGSETPTLQRKYTERKPKLECLSKLPVAEMADKYYRLVTIVVKICPDPLREMFLKHARTDQKLTTPYTTLDAYLPTRIKNLKKLQSKKILRQDQMNLIFPPSGRGQVNIAEWDITLLSLMLKELFKPQLQPSDDTNIDTIKDIRNKLQHISGTGQVTDLEFTNIYQLILSASFQLALSAKGQGYADKITQDIETVANSVITDLGDVLRQWYTAEIVQLKHEMNDLKEQIENVHKDTTETRKTIMKTTNKRLRAGEKMTKRFKTVDNILENMRGSFRALIKDFSSEDFTNPPEALQIARELEENHLVVISGYGSSPFEQIALSVIGSNEYDDDRCVVIKSPSDWRHISAEEVELVVFLHPFGKKTYDEDKSKKMHRILDEIQRSAFSAEEEDVIDVVIVTDQTILDECKKHFIHDVIENPIVVCKPTTVDSPVDLVQGESRVLRKESDPHYKNLLVQSIAYCKYHRVQFVDDNIKEHAVEIFKSKKVVVISGSRGSGKTALALSLLSSYREGHYLILTEPGDLRYIRFGVTCVVVIEDFGGKYEIELPVVREWFRKFDMLYPTVKDGKLNVIITCDSGRLNSCMSAISKHPLLECVVSLPNTGAVKIKQEPRTDEQTYTTFTNRGKGQTTLSFTSVARTETEPITLSINEGRVGDFCQHPDGSFLFFASTYGFISEKKIHLMHYRCNSKLDFISQYDMDDLPELYRYYGGICCTDTGDVVIYGRREQEVRLYRISDGTCQFIKSKDMPENVHNVCTYMNKIYVVCFDSSVYVMDSKLRVKTTIKLYQYFDEWGERKSPVVVCVKKKFFYSEEYYHNTCPLICDTPEQKQLTYMEIEDFESHSMCSAGDDSIFVLGKQGDEYSRILQVNTEMQILSDIVLKGKTYDVSRDRWIKMVFDRTNGRLIFVRGRNSLEQIYLN